MREGTTERILEIASRLIAERGVYGASFGDISAEAGMSKGTLHYYYPSKQALVEAAARRAVRKIGDSLFAWVDSVDPKDAPEHSLGSLCDALMGESIRVFIAANGVVEPGSALEEALDSAMSEWNVMIDVGSMRMRPDIAARMKRIIPAVLPFVTGLAALNADPDYSKEAFLALVMG